MSRTGTHPLVPADRLLATAESLLAQGGAGTRGWWPRAVAWLLRLVLEAQMDTFLAARGIRAAGLDGRAKLLMIRFHLGEDQARDVAAAWHGLSSAGHHHAYELAPTLGELQRWLDVVRTSPLAQPDPTPAEHARATPAR